MINKIYEIIKIGVKKLFGITVISVVITAFIMGTLFINEQLGPLVDDFLGNERPSMETCEWGMSGNRCSPTPCKRYNIQDLNCVYDGIEDSFPPLRDPPSYYVCEGYGRVKVVCECYYSSREEFNKDMETKFKT